jgi:hypothetical protein
VLLQSLFLLLVEVELEPLLFITLQLLNTKVALVVEVAVQPISTTMLLHPELATM